MRTFFVAPASFAIVLTLSAMQSAHAEAASESRQHIESVVETFRKAIINKDEDGFMKLFLREDITWDAAFDDPSLDGIMARRTDKSLPRPNKTFHSTPREFIKGIAKSSGPREETIDNVRIDTDGDVAQVWFDYSYKQSDYQQNWGKEAWQLVRTEDGWKIASVIWSMKLNPEPPPAKAK